MVVVVAEVTERVGDDETPAVSFRIFILSCILPFFHKPVCCDSWAFQEQIQSLLIIVKFLLLS